MTVTITVAAPPVTSTTTPSTVPVRARRAPRVPLSALPLAVGERPGALGASTVLAGVRRHPRHPGVASGASAVVGARVAARLGLPFVVDHRTTRTATRAAVAAYRAAFVAVTPAARPVVLVVADVVVASTTAAAWALAGPDAGRFVGSPSAVVAGLDGLVAGTDADEVLLTSIAVGEEDRRRGQALLAAAWTAR